MPGLSALTRRGKILLAAGVAVIVAAVVASIALVHARSADDHKTAEVAPPAAGDRLLQSVNATIGSDGALTQIGDTVVITRAGTGQFDTTSTTYDPSKAVDQLPVRVLTSYRTEKSSGTNLADLKGYTGRVTIDLNVQNLTVQPEKLSYDAGGRSRSATAMVGAPLTVVASAAMPGVDPATVVTPESDSEDPTGATNGVLSKASDQSAQVQWATILAPPQLSSTATLRLVLDAKDFAVPTIDIGVQPGLVTDPSVGALVDAAFNPKNSDELKLVSRTIEVVGDVNEVLGRASTQITKVRKTLDSTSKTLGATTVTALQSDTKQIDASLKQSDKNLNALDKSLQSSLKSTSSSTLEQLSSSVGQIDALLGDTSAKAPSVDVKGAGCAAQVKVPSAAGTVYGSLLQVTSMLNAYAKSTGECKDELQSAIKTTIGPADPSQGNCQEAATSVTCTLSKTFESITAALDASQQASDAIDPVKDFADSRAAITGLVADLNSVVADANDLSSDPTDQSAPKGSIDRLEDDLKDATDSLAKARTAFTGALEGVHDSATDNAQQVRNMIDQNTTAAEKLCDLIPEGSPPDPELLSRINEIRALLVPTNCADERFPTPMNPQPMEARLGVQLEAWNEVAGDTDSSQVDSKFGKLLADDGDLAQVERAVKAASAELATSNASIDSIRATASTSSNSLVKVEGQLGALQDKYTGAKKNLDDALTAAQKASDENRDDAIKKMSDQGAENSAQLGKAFENSAAGLSSAAKALQDSGKKSVNDQRSQLASTEKQASTSLSSAMTGSLDQVSGDIGSATRDLGSTRTQLTRDLANILLDLGDPKVNGSGVIGTLSKGAAAAGSADYQLAQATDQTTSYGSVREQDVAGIMLRQAQAEASLQRQADLPAFERELPDSVQHRTVYSFHLAGGR